MKPTWVPIVIGLGLLAAAACSSKQKNGNGTPPPGECEVSACGPAMGMPNQLCPDGKTTAGPSGRCLRNAEGTCAWEVIECPSEGGGGGGAACVRSGCSGTVCVEEGKEVITTCEYKPEYACYDKASCERQPDGVCGWTMNEDLKSCLAAGGAP